jgi:retinol dehydrogenase-12
MIKEMTQFEAVEVWELDLASFENVKAFGKRCSELERLDSVVLNAGIANRRWEVTKDGHEQT